MAGVPLTPAPDVHRRPAQACRPVRAGEHHRDAAVGDQAAVQQVQRLDDPPRGLVLADGERVAELGPRIAGRPPALRDGDRAELLARRAVAGHVPARRQGVLGRDGAVAESRRQAGQPLPLRPGGCRPAAGLQAERRAGRCPRLQRRVGEHAGHRAGRAADDGERGELDRRPRGGAVGVDHAEQAQVPQPQYLGQADIEDAAGDPRADQQPVQVAQLQAGIGGREPHRLGGQPPGGAAVDLAELGQAKPRDRRRRHGSHRTERDCARTGASSASRIAGQPARCRESGVGWGDDHRLPVILRVRGAEAQARIAPTTGDHLGRIWARAPGDRNQAPVRHRGSRLQSRQGAYRVQPRAAAEAARAAGDHAEARSVSQRRSGHHEPVPARRGVRDR